MNIVWFKLKSWHAFRGPTSAVSYCGRVSSPYNETSNTLPAGKSCETCLRLVARFADKE